MTLVSSLISDAYREGNIVAISLTPTSPQLTEGLGRLNSLFDMFFGSGMGEQLTDWIAPQPQRTGAQAANYPQLPFAEDLSVPYTQYPPKNSRIVWGGTNITIYLPEKPNFGSRISVVQGSGVGLGADAADGNVLTLDGNGRLIAGQPTYTITRPMATPLDFFYRSDTGNWVTFNNVALTDDCPFPPAIDDMWIILLAQRLAPRYGKTMSPESLRLLQKSMAVANQLFQQHQDVVYNGDQIPNTFESFGPPYGTFI